jgi:hypothetical protein
MAADSLPPDPHGGQPFRLRLRREVRRAELALLALGVVAAGFLALHLAERGNEVSLTARTAPASPTTQPGPAHAAPADAPSDVTRSSPPPAPPTTATASPPTPPTQDPGRAAGPETATTAPTVDDADGGTANSTTTSTTSSTTTTTTTTTTIEPPPP